MKVQFNQFFEHFESSVKTFALQLSLKLNFLNFFSLKLIKYVTLVTPVDSLTLWVR